MKNKPYKTTRTKQDESMKQLLPILITSVISGQMDMMHGDGSQLSPIVDEQASDLTSPGRQFRVIIQ
jgi:hypothetical protein